MSVNAVLIDPINQTITDIAFEQDPSLDEIYEQINARCFDCVQLTHEDSLYVDDEGLFVADQSFFHIMGSTLTLAGKALILGVNDQGETCSCSVSAKDLELRTVFLPSREHVQAYLSLH